MNVRPVAAALALAVFASVAAPAMAAGPVPSPSPPSALALPSGDGPFPAILTIGDVAPELSAQLLASGIAIYACDDCSVDDASAALEKLVANGHVDPGRVYEMGSGDGGLVALQAAEGRAPVRGVVLLDPTPAAQVCAELAKPGGPVLLLAGGDAGSGDNAAAIAAAKKGKRDLSYGELTADGERVGTAVIAWLLETE